MCNKIEKKQAKCLGYVVMREINLECLVTTGKTEGKSGGRRRNKILDGLATWLGQSTKELFEDAYDCGK